MKFYPALYTTVMVKALLDKRKTQTRRLGNLKMINESPDSWSFEGLGKNPEKENDTRLYAYFKTGIDTWTYCLSPFGQKGDVIWVRETWSEMGLKYNYVYKADGLCLETDNDRWFPSIFMPKNACRLFLKITNVRIERLNDISEHDANAEGVLSVKFTPGQETRRKKGKPAFGWKIPYRFAFEKLWEKINGFGSWDKNPFVWVYDFEQIDEPESFNP